MKERFRATAVIEAGQSNEIDGYLSGTEKTKDFFARTPEKACELAASKDIDGDARLLTREVYHKVYGWQPVEYLNASYY